MKEEGSGWLKKRRLITEIPGLLVAGPEEDHHTRDSRVVVSGWPEKTLQAKIKIKY